MRFRKRLSAAILAIVMMVSSIQIPGGTSYAAEMSDSGIESGQDASILTAEETEEDIETVGSESQPDEGEATDGGSRTVDENETSDDGNLGDGDSQLDDGNLGDGDSQLDDGNLGDGDSQLDDGNLGDGDNPAGDDSQTEDGNVPEEETDAEPVSDDDADEAKMEEAEIDGAYQFGDVPEQAEDSNNSIDVFSAVAYDDSVEEYLYQNMLNRTQWVDVSSYNISARKSNMDRLISGVLNEHPELYFVSKSYGYVRNSDGNIVSQFHFEYLGGCDDETFEENVTKALSYVDDEMSDVQKAAVLHDYLAVNVEYDEENLLKGTVPDTSYTAYGALVNRISVCEGYALAYKYLLSKVGIESYIVTSAAMNHAWNMVKMDGKYYHVDVTWDDPIWDMVGRVMHTYMFCSDSNLANHSGWQVTVGSNVVDYKATDSTYESAFWKQSTAPLVIKGNYCYYVSESGSLRRASFANIIDKGTEIVNIGSWPTWDGSGTWPGAYSGLYMIDGRLFYNDTHSIYSIAEDGTDKRTEFTAIVSDGYIYGSAYCQDKVYYALHKDPNLTVKEDVLVAELTGESGSDNPDNPDNPEEVDAPIQQIGTGEGYNIQNPHMEFLCPDWKGEDQTLSTEVKPGYGPYVLMFFFTDGEGGNQDKYTAQTFINAYAGSVNELGGAKLYAIESSGELTYDELKQWTKDNNCQYFPDYGRASADVLIAYTEAVQDKIDVKNNGYNTYPIIFYIDENDKIQYAWRQGVKTLDEMFDDLRKYCNYKRCRVTWNLNGGSGGGSEFYDTGSHDIDLPKPDYRPGYRFEGWYMDSNFTKKLTKIPQGTIADITLYAKWSAVKGPFGLDNLEQEYTALDDTKISSTADGKPKMLIFARNNGAFGMDVTSICRPLKEDPEHALHGVDLYMIDASKSSKSRLDECVSLWWSDEMKVSYDTGDGNQECLQAYAEKAGIDLEVISETRYPLIIFYIDAQNRLQYASTDISVDNIMFNLRAFCNYPTAGAKFYNIKYVMDGGTNNNENPDLYHSEMEENIVLKDPVKSGMVFDGWYADVAFHERVNEIDVSSARDITLYAKWKFRGGNYDNFDYTFDKLGGGTVTTTAENGRPKLLIFANQNCGFTPGTVENITKNIEWFKGVDIVCAVVKMTDEEDPNEYIANVKEQYGCDEISFALDKNDENRSLPWGYIRRGVAGGSAVTAYVSPLIVYIDANNRFQYVGGNNELETLMNNLRQYCNYDAYYINYELYGGINDSENPEVYFEDSETIVLKNPIRTGFKFEGWYREPEYKRQVTEIPAGSKSDYKLYAKWKEGGSSIDNLTQEYTALDDTTITSTASGKPKVLIFYRYERPGLNLLRDVSGELLNKPNSPLHGIDIYAIGVDNTQYKMTKQLSTTVKSAYGQNCDEIIYAYDKDSNNNEKVKMYKDAAGTGSGGLYYPMIVYLDENNCLQYVYYLESTADKTPTAADILVNLKKYCNYPIYYKITYELDGGTNSGENPYEYASGSSLTLSDPVKEGYVFDGWYKDAEFSDEVTEIDKESTGDITLYAKWKEAYEIIYVLDGGTNSEENPDKYVSGEKPIILSDPVKEGYRFRGWYTDAEFTETVTEISAESTGNITLYAKWEVNIGLGVANIEASFTTVDGTVISSTTENRPRLLVFYDNNRTDSTSTITNIKGIIDDLSGVDIYAIDINRNSKEEVSRFKDTYGCDGMTFVYDESFKNVVSMQNYLGAAGLPKSANAPVICYIDADNILQWVTYAEKETGEGILENLQKYCDWTGAEEGTYKITYVLDGGTNSSDNPASYTSETETITLKDAVREGYIFEGWYKDAEFKEQVREITKEDKGDITLYAKWKEASLEEGTYRITYELNGGENSSDNPAAYKEGTETITLKDAVREGYIFEGWYKDAEFKEQVREITKEDKGDITLYAKWKETSLEEGTYRITYELNGGENSSDNPAAYKEGTETITLKDAVREGYIFEGWYKDAEFKEQVKEITKEDKGDITLYAKWKEIPLEEETYRITYELNGGKNSSDNPAAYKEETETIILKDAVRSGYIFEGWYKDAEFKEKVTEITKGSKGDITLYARWSRSEADNSRSGISVRFMDYDSIEDSKPCYVYTGTAIKPAVEVYNNDTLLTLGTDYTLSYKNNTQVGKAALIVKGKGSFSGASDLVDFIISRADIDVDTNHPEEMTVIAGTKVTPVIMNGTKQLTTKDYQLEGIGLDKGKYTETTPAGVPNILTVKGIGSYDGSSFTIAVNVIDAKAAKKLAVVVDKNFKPEYGSKDLAGDIGSLFNSPDSTDGKITVTDARNKGQVLRNGKDFSVVCDSSLEEAGTVKFTVTGMGEYAGSVSKSFKISPLKVTDRAKFEVNFDAREYEYNAAGTTVDNLVVKYLGASESTSDDKVLTSGADYKVSYSNNKNISAAKKAQVKITFIGSYKGSRPVSRDFTIVSAKMAADGADANTDVVIPDKVYTKEGKAYKSTPIVTVDGVTVKPSNYTVTYAWRTESDEIGGEEYIPDNNVKVKLGESDNYAKVRVTITPKGSNYAADGVIWGEYYVRKAGGSKDISKAKVTFLDKDGKPIKALEYNGKTYYTPEGNNPKGGNATDDPNAVYVSVAVNGEDVDPSLYNVTWTNAKAKGKAVVVINGNGAACVGSKSQAINIKAMALKGKNFNIFTENAAYSLKNIFFKN